MCLELLNKYLCYAIPLLLWCGLGTTTAAQPDAMMPPNSRMYPNIPEGVLTKDSMVSEIYPNTIRDYYVYVPAQYDSLVPAALMVFQDGHTYIKDEGDFRVATVFNNLIAQEKMPVTIGLFINPGHDRDLPTPENPWRASNRSTEYDTLSDTYAEFLIEEMIPLLTSNYSISDDPNMRAICGISSGGICAFTAAWQRPDVFRRVLSHIGSFTNIKGGHHYPAMIRKSDVKPIKVFLQDGSNDLDNRHGNWFLANQQMAKALEFKNYDYTFVTDTGAHNGVQAGLILPQSLTWLWKDAVPSRLESSKYQISPGASEAFLKGETTHLANLECTIKSLPANQAVKVGANEAEKLIIIRSGQCRVSVSDRHEEILAANSVLFIPEQKTGSILALKDVQYLSIQMKKGGSIADDTGSENQPFVINFDSLSYKPHPKGGRHDYFHRSTAMFPYFEMHVTTLNPGEQSHPAHTHRAEELIIMIEGQTEEEIGNGAYQGDANAVYYLGAQVPHSIKNVGTASCRYFAFQWSDQ